MSPSSSTCSGPAARWMAAAAPDSTTMSAAVSLSGEGRWSLARQIGSSGRPWSNQAWRRKAAPPTERTNAARISIRAWSPCMPVIDPADPERIRVRILQRASDAHRLPVSGHQRDAETHDGHSRVDDVDDGIRGDREQPEQRRADEDGDEDHHVEDPEPQQRIDLRL